MSWLPKIYVRPLRLALGQHGRRMTTTKGWFRSTLSMVPRTNVACVDKRSRQSCCFTSSAGDIEYDSTKLEDRWMDVTQRLVTQDWHSEEQWEEAKHTLDWWIRKDQGAMPVILLLQKMSSELAQVKDSPVEKEDEEALPAMQMLGKIRGELKPGKDLPIGILQEILNEKRTQAIVEKWAQAYVDKDRPEDLPNPSELLALCESFQPHVPIDQSVLSYIIHRTCMRHQMPVEDGRSLSADNLLQILAYVEKNGGRKVCPEKSEIDSILREAFKNRSPQKDAHWAQAVVDAMWSITRKDKRTWIRPDYSIYLSLLKAWFYSTESNKSRLMRRLIDEMEASANDGVTGLYPGSEHFTLLLSAYANEGDFEEALKLMRHLKSRHDDIGRKNFIVTGKMYGICMAALANNQSSDPGRGIIAEFLRHEIFEAYEKLQDRRILPEVHFWTSYIRVFASMGDEKSMERAESILDEMQHTHKSFKPSVHHYGMVMRGWSKLLQPEKAERLLVEMVSEFNKGNTALKPDPKNFLDVLNAWNRSGDSRAEEKMKSLNQLMASMHKGPAGEAPAAALKMLSSNKNRGDAFHAEKLLRDMIREEESDLGSTKLSREHYQAVITAWSNNESRQAPNRAESLLFELLDKYDSGNDQYLPSEHAFTSVIAAFAKIKGSRKCGHRAQAVFDNMVKRFSEGEDTLRPSVYSYTALIKAWSSVGDSERAEATLQKMHADFLGGNVSAKPNRHSFNAVLSGWSKHPSEENLNRLVIILRLMDDMEEELKIEVKPDFVSYSIAIAGCMRSESPEKVKVAESLLKQAKERYVNGQQSCKPNCVMYGAVVQTLARTDFPDSAERSQEYLFEMLSLGDFDPKQIVLSFNAVLNAWSRHPDKELAFTQAEALVKNLVRLSEKRRTNACLPNKFTYSKLLHILSLTSLPDKTQRAESILKLMEAHGTKRDKIINQMAGDILREGCSSNAPHLRSDG